MNQISTPIKKARTHNVKLENFQFNPSLLVIQKFDSIEWRIGHNECQGSILYDKGGQDRFFVLQILEIDIESDLLREGDTYIYEFVRLGKYTVRCVNNLGSKSIVQVVESFKIDPLLYNAIPQNALEVFHLQCDQQITEKSPKRQKKKLNDSASKIAATEQQSRATEGSVQQQQQYMLQKITKEDCFKFLKEFEVREVDQKVEQLLRQTRIQELYHCFQDSSSPSKRQKSESRKEQEAAKIGDEQLQKTVVYDKDSELCKHKYNQQHREIVQLSGLSTESDEQRGNEECEDGLQNDDLFMTLYEQRKELKKCFQEQLQHLKPANGQIKIIQNLTDQNIDKQNIKESNNSVEENQILNQKQSTDKVQTVNEFTKNQPNDQPTNKMQQQQMSTFITVQNIKEQLFEQKSTFCIQQQQEQKQNILANYSDQTTERIEKYLSLDSEVITKIDVFLNILSKRYEVSRFLSCRKIL